jgi:trehalose 6-phosphate synthase/phosphatase
LPITASKDADTGKWTVQFDPARSNHMTPNLRMLTKNADVSWVGWPGVFVPKEDEDEFNDMLEKLQCRPVYLTPELKESFFDRCCKGVIWPLLHYRMPTSDLNFAKQWDTLWQSYTTANMLYSKQISSIVENERDAIWVHNYHLMLIPSFLRKKMPRAKIGFFIHTPWPTSDVFRTIPGRANILRGILCSDLIGFHTYDYARHFLSSVKRVLDLEVESLPGGSLGVTYNGRDVCIRISHVGIPAEIYQQITAQSEVQQRSEQIRREVNGRMIIVGVDELDLVKGTMLKFQAFERFLAQHPEYRKQVVLMEIISGSYNTKEEKMVVRNQVMQEVTNIRRLYGEDVIRIVEPPPGELWPALPEVVAIYRAATVGFISTFWDGLNIIPFEFTACQDEENPAALIVSEFMGCSRSLSGVLRVNPWRLEQVADAIHSALEMDVNERRGNHRRRFKYVTTHTLEAWANGFLQDLDKAAQRCDDLNLVQVGWGSNVCLIGLRKNFAHLDSGDINFHFRRASRRLLIFDYDGTLTSESDRYLCRPSDRLLGHLQSLCRDPRNVTFIMSGRERKVLSDWFSTVKGLGLASEKGCFVRWPGSEQWQVTHSVKANEWKPIALELIQQYTDCTDGSYVEDKESAIVWHYEAADPEYGRMQASELAKFLESVLSLYHVDVVKYDYNRILEVKPRGVNKGVTTKAILQRLAKQFKSVSEPPTTPFFALCVGDDRSDEDMFHILEPSSPLLQQLTIPPILGSDQMVRVPAQTPRVYTVCVGLKPSSASHYLHDPQEVLDVIEGLTTCTEAYSSGSAGPQSAIDENGDADDGGYYSSKSAPAPAVMSAAAIASFAAPTMRPVSRNSSGSNSMSKGSHSALSSMVATNSVNHKGSSMNLSSLIGGGGGGGGVDSPHSGEVGMNSGLGTNLKGSSNNLAALAGNSGLVSGSRNGLSAGLSSTGHQRSGWYMGH